MKIRIKELKRLIKEASKKQQQLLGIDPNKVINPAEGRDEDEIDSGMKFAKFLSNLAKGMTDDQVFVCHGHVYKYVIDPKDFLNIHASDSSKLPVKYLSDLGKYTPEFYDLMFMTEPENFSDYVEVREFIDPESREDFFAGIVSLSSVLKR